MRSSIVTACLAHLRTHAVVHHGGEIPGFGAEQLWLPGDTLRVILFTNTPGSNPQFLADNLASAVPGLPLKSKTKLPDSVPLAAGYFARDTRGHTTSCCRVGGSCRCVSSAI